MVQGTSNLFFNQTAPALTSISPQGEIGQSIRQLVYDH
jgi:hypothetical protein